MTVTLGPDRDDRAPRRVIAWWFYQCPQWLLEVVVYGFVILAALTFALWMTW